METAGIVYVILGIACVEKCSLPGPKGMVQLALLPVLSIADARTEAGRPRRSTCPGTGNRLPEREPLAQQLYHSKT